MVGEEGNKWNLETALLKLFTDCLAADHTSGVLSVISVEKSAACDIRVHYTGAESGLGRTFLG